MMEIENQNEETKEIQNNEEIFYDWDLARDDKLNSPDLSPEERQKIEDEMWMSRTGLNYETLSGAIETILFLNDKPTTIQALRATLDSELPLRVIHQAISRLQEEYEQKHHGIRLMEVAEGFQFRTKAIYSKFVNDLFKINAVTLTPLALEVLAIIAYRQPISKTDIDQIRGVDSSHLIRGLMDKKLVKIAGRSEDLGKPTVYGTTLEFLEVFNMPNLEALPSMHELEELAQAKTVGEISEIKKIVEGDKTKFFFDEIGELDALAEKIKDISPHTEFTKSLKEQTVPVTDDQGNVLHKSAFDVLEDFIAQTKAEQNLASNDEASLEVTYDPNEPVDGEISVKVRELINEIKEKDQPLFAEEDLESLDSFFTEEPNDGDLVVMKEVEEEAEPEQWELASPDDFLQNTRKMITELDKDLPDHDRQS